MEVVKFLCNKMLQNTINFGFYKDLYYQNCIKCHLKKKETIYLELAMVYNNAKTPNPNATNHK